MFVDKKQSLFTIMPCLCNPFEYVIQAVLTVPSETCLKQMFINRLISEKYIRSLLVPDMGRERFSRLHRMSQYKSQQFDISTLKIWCAIIFLIKRDYKTALRVLEELKSCIPPFDLYEPRLYTHENYDADQLNVVKFVISAHDTIRRSREAWMFNKEFIKRKSDALPLAIQIEVYFSHVVFRRVRISPFTCLYYMLFLCYHELKQYCQRDRVFVELENIATDDLKNGHIMNRHHAFNITGHCLLIAKQKDRALKMFKNSHDDLTRKCPTVVQYNSAMWYMKKFLYV